MLTAIRQWVIRTMMKSKGETGIVQTMPKRDLVELNTQITAQRLMQNGINPEALKNANQVENAIIAIENKQKANLAENIRGGIRDTETAKVFDMEGKEIPRGSKIMGGKEVSGTSDRARVRNEMKKKYGFTDEKLDEIENTPIDEKMADDLIREDDERIIKERLEKGNKEAVQRIRMRKAKEYKLNLFKNLDDKKKLNDDEYEEFLVEIGGEDRLEAYDFDGTVGSAKRILKDDVEYEEYMFDQYTKGKLDPEKPKSNKPITSMDKQINEEFQKGMKEGKFDNVRLKDGRRIESEDDFRDYIDELNEDNNFDFAQGGRAGFKEGSGMTRRSFLKILGGLATIPIVGKFLKPIKTAKGIKSVPIIKTDNVPGKPEWFDALVNKVIIEGDDVTKKFATGERQSIHQKTLDDGSVVRVTEDVDDGAVRVEYDSDANVFEDTVQLQYKKPLPDEGDPRPTAEFTTAESGPVGRSYGPDDYEIDVDEVGGTSIRDLDSDVSKLKEYATGKKPTMKELVQNIERRKRAKQITEDPEAQSDAVIRRQGEADDSYYGDPGEFASGGIARMLGE